MTQYGNDGFSADGLSYSVANDFSKQMGQALADYEARTKNPRFIPGARVENPDAPDLLRQQLIDPIEQAWQGNRPAVKPIVHVVGNSLVQFDPRSNRTNVLFSNPPAVKSYKTPEITKRQASDLADIEYQLKLKRKALLNSATTPEAQLDLKNDLVTLEKQRRAVFNPVTPSRSVTGTNMPAIRVPQGIIGSPNDNRFQTSLNGFQAPTAPAAPAAIGAVAAPAAPGPKRYKYNKATGNFE